MEVQPFHKFQIDWDAFEVDWEGPVPLHDDNDIVTVEESEEILSSSQKQQLKSMLSQVSHSDYSQQEMLTQFVIAKSIVHKQS